MAKKYHPRNPFNGKWKVLRLYCNVHNQGWVLFKIYGNKSFIWEFSETEKVEFPSGNVFYSGMLREFRRNHAPEETEYSFSSKDKRLYIDRSHVEQDNFINICINEHYRVEHINDNDIWLYDLENVGKEPEEYRFKMKIRRIKDDKE